MANLNSLKACIKGTVRSTLQRYTRIIRKNIAINLNLGLRNSINSRKIMAGYVNMFNSAIDWERSV